MISKEKLKMLTHLQKLPKNVRDLGKLIVAKGFEKLPSPINRPIWSQWFQVSKYGFSAHQIDNDCFYVKTYQQDGSCAPSSTLSSGNEPVPLDLGPKIVPLGNRRRLQHLVYFYLKNGPYPASFIFISRLFQTHIKLYFK